MGSRTRSRPVWRSAVSALAAALLAGSMAGCVDVRELEEAEARAPQFNHALAEACASGETVPATELISEPWDRLLVVREYTSGKAVNKLLGFHYTSDDNLYGARVTLFLANKNRVVVQATYGYQEERPPIELPSPGMVLPASSLKVVPREDVPPPVQDWLKEIRYQDCVLLSPADTEILQHTGR